MQGVECVVAVWAKPGAHNRLYGLSGDFSGGLAICAIPPGIPLQGQQVYCVFQAFSLLH